MTGLEVVHNGVKRAFFVHIEFKKKIGLPAAPDTVDNLHHTVFSAVNELL